MSDSFILQTYPFREADLVVSFFARSVARHGGRKAASDPVWNDCRRDGLVHVSYYPKENCELMCSAEIA